MDGIQGFRPRVGADPIPSPPESTSKLIKANSAKKEEEKNQSIVKLVAVSHSFVLAAMRRNGPASCHSLHLSSHRDETGRRGKSPMPRQE